MYDGKVDRSVKNFTQNESVANELFKSEIRKSDTFLESALRIFSFLKTLVIYCALPFLLGKSERKKGNGFLNNVWLRNTEVLSLF